MFIIVSHRDLGDCLLHSIIVTTADEFAGHSFTQQTSSGCYGLGMWLEAGDGKTLFLDSSWPQGASWITEPWLSGCGETRESLSLVAWGSSEFGVTGWQWVPVQAGSATARLKLHSLYSVLCIGVQMILLPLKLRPHRDGGVSSNVFLLFFKHQIWTTS